MPDRRRVRRSVFVKSSNEGYDWLREELWNLSVTQFSQQRSSFPSITPQLYTRSQICTSSYYRVTIGLQVSEPEISMKSWDTISGFCFFNQLFVLQSGQHSPNVVKLSWVATRDFSFNHRIRINALSISRVLHWLLWNLACGWGLFYVGDLQPEVKQRRLSGVFRTLKLPKIDPPTFPLLHLLIAC